jgi:peptide/nickel transport system permease protein
VTWAADSGPIVIRYIAGRFMQMILVLLLVSIGAFMLIHLVPGDPAQVTLGLRAPPAQIARLDRQLGLDKPLLTQYWRFISHAVTSFNFGTSFQTQQPVGSEIIQRAGASLLLVAMSLLFSVIMAVPLGIIAAVRRRTPVDNAIQVVPTLTMVMPSFWLALLLAQVFSLRLGLLPTSGYGSTFPQHLRSLVLPAATMALGLFPVLVRLLRSSVIEQMQSEYIEAARARGLSNARVILKHVLRNSAVSTVTILGLLAGLLLSATVIVEQIFSIPGLGSLMVSAVGARDFPVVSALVLLFGAAVLIASLLTDLAYALLDPRVRLGARG